MNQILGWSTSCLRSQKGVTSIALEYMSMASDGIRMSLVWTVDQSVTWKLNMIIVIWVMTIQLHGVIYWLSSLWVIIRSILPYASDRVTDPSSPNVWVWPGRRSQAVSHPQRLKSVRVSQSVSPQSQIQPTNYQGTKLKSSIILIFWLLRSVSVTQQINSMRFVGRLNRIQTPRALRYWTELPSFSQTV